MPEHRKFPRSRRRISFFERIDWLGFGVAFGIALIVYVFTAAPEVTLEYSGVLSASAMYPGAALPPGHPLWEIYGWVFIHIIPFSNIAWRLEMSSAVAGAFTCGLIALMVSRVGILLAARIERFDQIQRWEKQAMRLVCGLVAGLGFGFSGCFWPKVTVVDTWPLSLCLLSITLCFLTRWFFWQRQRRYLYLASLTLGLTVSESQALIPMVFGLPYLVLMGNRRLGRDLLFGFSLFLWVIIFLDKKGGFEAAQQGRLYYAILIIAAKTISICWAFAALITRRLLTEWKSVGVCGALFFTALNAYFLLPIFSMTAPAVDWAHPRTVEGFLHSITYGFPHHKADYGVMPTFSFTQFQTKLEIYLDVTGRELGWFYLLTAVLMLVLLPQSARKPRNWIIGLFLTWICITPLISTVLDLSLDREALYYERFYLAPTYLLLTILAGCGLMMVAGYYARPAINFEAGHLPLPKAGI